jgi:uncharacterized membrane protein
MDRGLLYRFPYTSVAVALAIAALVAGVFWNINVFAIPGADIIGIEQNEIGEIVIAFLLVIPAFFVDRLVGAQRRHEAQMQAEQLRVLRVTMRTVQDIVNNNLNQLQLLRLEAEGQVPAETLRQFDETIRDTAAQLAALGNMQVFAEKPMASGSGLDVSTSARSTPMP